MKTSAVIRIILWSMVVVLLTCILAVGLSGGELLGRPLPFGFSGVGFSGSGFSYPDAGRYTAGGGSFPADQVDSIEINWVSGGVTVRSYEGSELAFDETIRGQADDSMRMRHYLKDRTLVIQFCAPRQSVFRSANSPVKTLEILVPESLAARMDEAEISVASASIQVSGITADKLEIDSVSGSTDITDTSCRSFELDTVSGASAPPASPPAARRPTASAARCSLKAPLAGFSTTPSPAPSGSARRSALSGSKAPRSAGASTSRSPKTTASPPITTGSAETFPPTSRRPETRAAASTRTAAPASPSIPSAATSPSSADDHGKTPGAHDCARAFCLFSRRPSIEGAG